MEENEVVETKKPKKVLSVEDGIKKEFGDGVIVNGNYITEQKKTIIPFSPAIDCIIGGGISEGSFVILSGFPKCGKSSSALHFAAQCQKKEYGSREVYYLNCENRIKSRDLLGINNLQMDKFHIIQSTSEKILHAGDFLNITHQLMCEKKNSVFIIDSFSALQTEAEMTNDMNTMQRCDGPKLLAKFCRKSAPIINLNSIILLGICHLVSNPSGYGAAYSESGGQKIKYQSDYNLRCRSSKPWKLSEDGPSIGLNVEWEAVTTGLDMPPGGRCESFIKFGEGIDCNRELSVLSIDLGIIKKSGAWYELPMLEGKKIQGLDKVSETIKDTPGLYDKIYNEVKTILGLKN